MLAHAWNLYIWEAELGISLWVLAIQQNKQNKNKNLNRHTQFEKRKECFSVDMSRLILPHLILKDN